MMFSFEGFVERPRIKTDAHISILLWCTYKRAKPICCIIRICNDSLSYYVIVFSFAFIFGGRLELPFLIGDITREIVESVSKCSATGSLLSLLLRTFGKSLIWLQVLAKLTRLNFFPITETKSIAAHALRLRSGQSLRTL